MWTNLHPNTALSFRTFSKLRLHEYTSTKDAKPLDALAPTSNSILGHVYRSFSVIRDVVCLLDHNYHRSDPLQYKWHRESGILLPDMCLNPLPDKKRVSCKCQGKCSSKKCSCKAEGEKCTAFCHGKTSACLNWFFCFFVLALEIKLTAIDHFNRFVPLYIVLPCKIVKHSILKRFWF